MSNVLNFTGFILGIISIIAGAETISNYNDYQFAIVIGIMLITQGIFIICLSSIIAKMSEQIKTILDDLSKK